MEMSREELISIPFNSVVNLEDSEINIILDDFIKGLGLNNKGRGIISIVRFKLFDTVFTYYSDEQKLVTNIGDAKLVIMKGEDGVKVIEDIDSVTKDLDKSDAITKLIEYQKEKQIACKIYKIMKKKLLPKYKRKGLNRKKK